MTEEKKNGDVPEQADDKKPDAKVEKAEEEVKKSVEVKDAVESKKEKVSKDKGEQKETTVKKVEVKDEKKETDKIIAKEVNETVEEKSNKKDINNLNFYSDLRTDIPVIRSGDILKVFYRVVEGGKERIQIFEGTVIAIKNSGISKTITVRKTSFGISIERIFPLNSKLVQKIEVIKHSRVRRAKLYYLRKLKGKAARLKELR